MKRFQICQLSGPAEGMFSPDAEAMPGADFATREEALSFVGAFPGSGYGYIWDRQEARAVHIFAWTRKAKAN